MQPSDTTWTILIVDDEHDVFEVFDLAFGGRTMVGRPLEVFWCESGQRAREVIAEIAPHLALIDIVMETEHAGFELIEWVNQHLDQPPAMMVYTGQPGVLDTSALDTTRGVAHVLHKSQSGLNDLKRVIEAMLTDCHHAFTRGD